MKTTLTKNQKQTKVKTYMEHSQQYRIAVTLRYDDDCGNGRNSFGMTADIREKRKNGQWVEYMGGCCHEEIVKHFPEFKHLVKWHLCSSDGPMHYVANTVYHAGNKDYNGHLKGDTTGSDFVIYWGKSPFPLNLKSSEAKRLGDRIDKKGRHKPKIHQIAHKNDGGYKFDDKFTFDKSDKWWECPFDTYSMAVKAQCAIFFGDLRVEEITTGCSEGKERALFAARSCAIWPDATDEELTSDGLKERLEARLPALLADFQDAMTDLGFTY